VISDDDIKREFLAAGFTVKPGHDDLKPYVYKAAHRVLALAAAQRGLESRKAFEAYAAAKVMTALADERERWREVNALAQRLELAAGLLADENERLREALLKCKTCALPTEVRDLVRDALGA
jgi:hypothetical protein